MPIDQIVVRGVGSSPGVISYIVTQGLGSLGGTPPVATEPDPPIIGVAVAGVGYATVSFTPPGDDGGATITGYTATSTPGSITSSGASSPIVVTGLTSGVEYTFTVHATNSVGNSAESAASNVVTPTAPAEVVVVVAAAGSMTFLDIVNRIFRSNGIIRGDDDAITTFDDTSHNAAIQLAMIAVQDELNDLIADNIIPYEVTSGTLVTAPAIRTYALAADFVRFYGHPKFYRPVANRPLYEWPGGRNSLSNSIWTYATDPGEPNWWYLEPTTTKRIGFYHVPNAVFTYTYDYERSVSIAVSSDTLPFHNHAEGWAFSQAAGRRFKALREGAPDVMSFILKDPTYTTAKSTLMGLMKGKNPYTRYGVLYR